MIRSTLLAVCGILAASSCAAPAEGPQGPADASALRPNIIFIVADDLGYGDVSANGSKIPTPNIDRLGKEGARFTDAHAMGSVCSPSRAALMTARYQSRFGHDVNPVGVPPAEASLPIGERTIAQRMKAAGYATGLVGKWHLGYGDGYHPIDRGFDETFGFNATSRFITQPEAGDLIVDVADNDERAGAVRRLFRGKQPIEDKGYLTDILNRESIGFIERHKDQPFFLVVTHYASHVPLQATKRYVDRTDPKASEGDRVYAAMTMALDDSVGEIVQTVDRLGLGKRTLIVFMSDNGCPAYLNGLCSNATFSGHKRDLLEGGHRGPVFARWPGVIAPGRTIDQTVLSIDFSATAMALAGEDPEKDAKVDGRSLLPLLRGASSAPPHETMFWRAGATYAVRSGDWKLIVAERRDGSSADFLFNLRTDPGETRNLAAAEASRVATLKAAFAEFDKGNIPPRFKPRKIEVSVAGEKVLMSY